MIYIFGWPHSRWPAFFSLKILQWKIFCSLTTKWPFKFFGPFFSLFNQRTFFWLVARVVSLVFFRCSTFPLESVGLKVWNSNFRSQSIRESAMLASSLIRAPIALSSDWCYQFLKFGKRQPMSQRQWLFVSSPLAIRCYRFIRSLTNLLLSKIYWKVLVRIFWLPTTESTYETSPSS